MQLMHCMMPIGGLPAPLPLPPYCSRLAVDPRRCAFREAGTTSSPGAGDSPFAGVEACGGGAKDAGCVKGYAVALGSMNAGGCEDHWCCCGVGCAADAYDEERILLTEGDEEIGVFWDVHCW